MTYEVPPTGQVLRSPREPKQRSADTEQDRRCLLDAGGEPGAEQQRGGDEGGGRDLGAGWLPRRGLDVEGRASRGRNALWS